MPKLSESELAEVVRHVRHGATLDMDFSEAKRAFNRRYFFRLMLGSRGDVPTVQETAQMASPAAVRQKMQSIGLWPREVYQQVLAASAETPLRKKEQKT